MIVQSMPALRDRDVITAEISKAALGKGSDLGRASLAEIELAISTADADEARGAHSAALDGYRRAQGLIFRLLHPKFEVSQWLRDRALVPLPVGPDVEQALLAAGAGLITMLRPQASVTRGVPAFGADTLPEQLLRFTTSGFRKAADGDDLLETVATQALSLVADGKPELAVTAMQQALSEAQGASPHSVASTRLNLAASLLQIGKADEAAKEAAVAVDAFHKLQDTMGSAQALHAQGVAAAMTGDQQTADKLFTLAQRTLGLNDQQGVADGHAPVGDGAAASLAARLADVQAAVTRTATLDAVTLPIAEVSGLDGWASEVVNPVRSRDVHALTVRLPGRLQGWEVLPVPESAAWSASQATWFVGVPIGRRIADLVAAPGTTVSADDLRQAVYADRTHLAVDDLHLVAVDATTTASYLTHLYAYALPLRIGDCLHALGLYAQAEASYVQCTDYSFLNAEAEASAVWIRIARNACDWGDALYKALDRAGASTQYGKIIAADGTEPAGSLLYATASLATPAAAAREVIAHLHERPLPPLDWQIAHLLLGALGYLQQIAGDLDFYGLALYPIYTFEYLQDAARGFAQEAIQAEREYVSLKMRQQVDEATRRDLETAKAMAWAEAAGREELYRSAQADVTAASAALNLAIKRRDDARTQRDQYAASSWTQIWSQAASTAQGMGSDSWFNEISELADKLDRGEDIHGDRGKLAAAYVLQAGRRTRTYELAKMDDTIAELQAAIPAAQAQLTSADARASAAEIAWQAAIQRAQLADASLAAFDANEFTPQTWAAMADVMRAISRAYLWRAIRLAKLMERAYNFEHDSTLSVIKDDYGYALANASGADAVLLGGDALLADVESFTYVAITTTLLKPSRVKDVISLAEQYPAHIEQFRQTGVLAFETDLYEFDRLHPGFYQQRIEAVEIEFVGLVPAEGLNGTLAAGGVTRYRTRSGDTGQRLHQVDTMALSDYLVRNDLFLFQAPTGVRGLFQGIGVGSTWELRLPKRSNDLDFRRIVDVRLVLYYTALFDAGLRSTILTRPARDGELSAVRDFNLRYDAPDAWYGFYRTSAVDFALDAVRLPANQTSFTVEDVQLRVQTRDGVSPDAIELSVVPPGGAAVALTTDASGAADLSGAAQAIIGTSPLGTWHIAVTGGASLTDGGAVQPGRVVSIQLGLSYGYALPVEEP